MNRVVLRSIFNSALCVMLLSCSATYQVARVAPQEIKLAEPGIYYMLPKTQVLTVLSISQTKKQAGRLPEETWDNCVDMCVTDKLASCPIAKATASTSYEVTAAKVYTRTLADPDHLYKSNVDFGVFAAFNHSFKMSDQGFLTYANAELENKAVEIGINAVKAIAKIAVSAASPGPLPAGASDLSCQEFQQLYTSQMKLDSGIADLEDKFEKALIDQPELSAPAIDLLKQRKDERILELKKNPEFAKVLAARKESTTKKSLGDFATLVEPPAAEISTKDWQAIQSIDLEGFPGLQAAPADLDAMDSVKKMLGDENFQVTVKPAVAFVACDPEKCDGANPKESGFRYRVPASAVVSVSRESGKKVVIGSARTLVAQYGALVSLPAKVQGIKSKIVLDMYEATGSVRQVDVGTTPQPTSLVGDVLSPVQEELDRRKKEAEDKKTKAEGAEVADLTKERDLLKLKKEIKDLEDSLKEDDEP